MNMEQQAALQLFSAMGLGWVIQWTLFAPKKVPSWVAWGLLGLASVGCYIWATPTVFADFTSNWRLSLLGAVQFFLTAKGTGSGSAAAKAAPKSNTL